MTRLINRESAKIGTSWLNPIWCGFGALHICVAKKSSRSVEIGVIRLFALVILVLTVRSPSAAFGEAFYVKSRTDCEFNGNGRTNRCALSNGGEGAWRGSTSIAFGNRDGQVGAGDTVFFTGKWAGVNSADGQSLYEITVNGSGTKEGAVIFDFTSAIIDCAHEVERGISIGAEHDYVLRNPTILRCGIKAGYGISVDGGHAAFDLSVRIENPSVSDITGLNDRSVGIRGKGSNVKILNPKIDGVSDDGIWIDGDSASAECDSNDGKTCFIKNIGLGSGVTGDCVQYGATTGLSLSGHIKRVVCDHRTTAEKQCFISNGLGLLKVEESVCLMPDFDGRTLTNGIYTEGTLYAHRNYIRGGRIGILMAMRPSALFDENQVFSNVIQESGYRAVSVGGGTKTSVVTVIGNNTISCAKVKGAVGVFLDGYPGTTINVLNNSLLGCDIAFSASGVRLLGRTAHNNDYRSKMRFFKVRDGGGNSSANPIVPRVEWPSRVDEFRPGKDSPLMRAGECGVVARDFDGVPFGCPPAVGSFAH